MEDDQLIGFSETEAQTMIGKKVRPRNPDLADPVRPIRRLGRVTEMTPSEFADGYALVVAWGVDEFGVYDTLDNFQTDLVILGDTNSLR